MEFNTIAGFRLAISAYHKPIDGFLIGLHLRVATLLSGIFQFEIL